MTAVIAHSSDWLAPHVCFGSCATGLRTVCESWLLELFCSQVRASSMLSKMPLSWEPKRNTLTLRTSALSHAPLPAGATPLRRNPDAALGRGGGSGGEGSGGSGVRLVVLDQREARLQLRPQGRRLHQALARAREVHVAWATRSPLVPSRSGATSRGSGAREGRDSDGSAWDRVSNRILNRGAEIDSSRVAETCRAAAL